jgi:hypothetical protein
VASLQELLQAYPQQVLQHSEVIATGPNVSRESLDRGPVGQHFEKRGSHSCNHRVVTTLYSWSTSPLRLSGVDLAVLLQRATVRVDTGYLGCGGQLKAL